MVSAFVVVVVATLGALAVGLEAAAGVLVAFTFAAALDNTLPADLRSRLGEGADTDILLKLTPAI